MKVWEGKQGVGFLLQGGLLRSQLDQLYNGRTKLSSTFFLIRYIGAQSDLTQVTTLTQKTTGQGKSELWKFDRQFCGTVYVISWTVVLILSSSDLWIWNTCLYHSKTLLVKQGTFLFEVWPDSAEKGDILNTGDLDISGIGYCNSVHWWIVSHQWKQNSDLFVDGRNKEIRQTQD